MMPTYLNLKTSTSWWHPTVMYCSGSPAPQGNPRHFKYYWRIFHLDCPWEEGEFFKNAPVFSNAECEKEIARLLARRRSCAIYGFRRPRQDPTNPFDPTHPRWAGTTFVMSWDEDTDPPVAGGHK